MSEQAIPAAAIAAANTVHSGQLVWRDIEEMLRLALPHLRAQWEAERADYDTDPENCPACHYLNDTCPYHQGYADGVTWMATAVRHVATEAIAGDANLAAMVHTEALQYLDLQGGE